MMFNSVSVPPSLVQHQTVLCDTFDTKHTPIEIKHIQKQEDKQVNIGNPIISKATKKFQELINNNTPFKPTHNDIIIQFKNDTTFQENLKKIHLDKQELENKINNQEYIFYNTKHNFYHISNIFTKDNKIKTVHILHYKLPEDINKIEADYKYA